ncbi:MAG: phosphate transport system permease protein [Gaiellaceae bacterium]|nr:phosphate transport system permease protein [Gaiellaceae bacterium]
MSSVDTGAFGRPTPRLRRRKLVNRLMETLASIAALLAVAVLVVVVVSVLRRGAGALSLDFFTKTPAAFGASGGGLANSFVGSLVLVGIATAMALPAGVLIAIFVSELAPRRLADAIRLSLDVINGIPSIVIGIFVFELLVLGHRQSGWAGSVALAIIMLPLISRSTQEVLRLVPSSLREAGLALGVSRWRTVLGVVLPSSLGGVLTGTTLAVARAAGETAPLLFTTSLTSSLVTASPSQALQSVPLSIFELSESPDPADHARAWAAAFVLMLFVLITSLLSRAHLARSRRKLGR